MKEGVRRVGFGDGLQALALDDDGDLDLVTGNWLQANRLYLNNGTANPWNGVGGVDITSMFDKS